MNWKKYLLCILTGIVFFIAAESVNEKKNAVEKGVIYRNPCGKGEAVYEFYVDGIGENHEKLKLSVPERQMPGKEFHERVPEIERCLRESILGENPSLDEVRNDLELDTELSEYGVLVSWSSDHPEVVSRIGTVYGEEVPESGQEVILTASLTCGEEKEELNIHIMVYPQMKTKREQFTEHLECLAEQNRESERIALPMKFDGESITYRSTSHRQNFVLLFLGVIAAGCLWIKEKSDKKELRKRREDELNASYHDLVSGFLILTGAGYSSKAAWKKLTKDLKANEKRQTLVREMETAVNQMDTGTVETQAYAAFGRRCGVRCYIRFASLLESSVSTGGKNLRKLLETEMDEAFKQRADLARRKGEEASSKLLLPMFGMLGIVMVMVVAPAFLSIS